jgi:hypothetical protein
MFTMTTSVVVLNVLAFVVIDPSAFIVVVAKLVCIGSIVVVVY